MVHKPANFHVRDLEAVPAGDDGHDRVADRPLVHGQGVVHRNGYVDLSAHG